MAKAKNNICTKLLASYQPEQALQSRELVSTSEKGIHYIAEIEHQRDTVVFQVDGSIITDGIRCDKLILAKDSADGSLWTGCFVELKGSDIGHAIEQLENTITRPIFKDDRTLQNKFARIVSSSKMPTNTGNSPMEKARNKFKEKYKCELKRLRSRQLDKI